MGNLIAPMLQVGVFVLAYALIGCGGTEDSGGQSSTRPDRDDKTDVRPSDNVNSGPSGLTIFGEVKDLMAVGKHQEGYEKASLAMAAFSAEGNNLAWLILESIDVDGQRIDVHFNMGPQERKLPDDGIARPLSFRIWPTNEDQQLEIIDFEIGRSGGKSITAALGSMIDGGHANYGILNVDSSYEQIRTAVLDLIDARAKRLEKSVN